MIGSCTQSVYEIWDWSSPRRSHQTVEVFPTSLGETLRSLDGTLWRTQLSNLRIENTRPTYGRDLFKSHWLILAAVQNWEDARKVPILSWSCSCRILVNWIESCLQEWRWTFVSWIQKSLPYSYNCVQCCHRRWIVQWDSVLLPNYSCRRSLNHLQSTVFSCRSIWDQLCVT